MRLSTHTAVTALAVATALLSAPVRPGLSAHAQGPARPASAARAKLATLSTLQDLKAAFNTDRGHVRIILLLSPT